MGNTVKRRLLCLVGVLAAAVVIPGASTAATTETVTFSGRAAESVFFQSSGCIYTSVYVQAFQRARDAKQSGGATLGEPLWRAPGFKTPARRSTSAALLVTPRTPPSGSTRSSRTRPRGECCRALIGRPAARPASSRWTRRSSGIGDRASWRGTSQYRNGSVFVSYRFSGQTRNAQVSSASIAGCGVAVSERDAVSAYPPSYSSGQITSAERESRRRPVTAQLV